LSLSLRNPRRLILAWLRCMGASARESRVSVAIYSLDVVGHPGLHQSGITSLCLVGCFSPGPRRNDLMIYWAFGPFVRSFTPLVDPGDIYPPQAAWCAASKIVGCSPGETLLAAVGSFGDPRSFQGARTCPGNCRRRLRPGRPSWRSAPEVGVPARRERCQKGTGGGCG
jgi:hypothetical protein